MVAVREVVTVLTAAVRFIEPLLVPDEEDIVSQDEASLLTVQLSLVLMDRVFDSPEAEKLSEFSDTESVISISSWGTFMHPVWSMKGMSNERRAFVAIEIVVLLKCIIVVIN